MHNITFALFTMFFFTWAGLAYLFFNNKKPKSYIFGKVKAL